MFRTTPVSTFVIVTGAPGTTAPVGSVIVPTMVASCAIAVPADSNRSRPATGIRLSLRLFMVSLLPEAVFNVPSGQASHPDTMLRKSALICSDYPQASSTIRNSTKRSCVFCQLQMGKYKCCGSTLQPVPGGRARWERSSAAQSGIFAGYHRVPAQMQRVGGVVLGKTGENKM